MAKNNVSLIIPVLDEQESIGELYTWIKKVLKTSKLKGELIFIDDGSTDDSWKEISKLAATDDHVQGLRFTRNYEKARPCTRDFKFARETWLLPWMQIYKILQTKYPNCTE